MESANAPASVSIAPARRSAPGNDQGATTVLSGVEKAARLLGQAAVEGANDRREQDRAVQPQPEVDVLPSDEIEAKPEGGDERLTEAGAPADVQGEPEGLSENLPADLLQQELGSSDAAGLSPTTSDEAAQPVQDRDEIQNEIANASPVSARDSAFITYTGVSLSFSPLGSGALPGASTFGPGGPAGVVSGSFFAGAIGPAGPAQGSGPQEHSWQPPAVRPLIAAGQSGTGAATAASRDRRPDSEPVAVQPRATDPVDVAEARDPVAHTPAIMAPESPESFRSEPVDAADAVPMPTPTPGSDQPAEPFTRAPASVVIDSEPKALDVLAPDEGTQPMEPAPTAWVVADDSGSPAIVGIGDRGVPVVLIGADDLRNVTGGPAHVTNLGVARAEDGHVYFAALSTESWSIFDRHPTTGAVRLLADQAGIVAATGSTDLDIGSLAVDDIGHLYLMDAFSASLVRIDRRDGFAEVEVFASTLAAIGVSDLNASVGITASNDRVFFVAETSEGDAVVEWKSGAGIGIVARIGRAMDLTGDLAVSPSGTLVAFDGRGGRFVEVDPEEGSVGVVIGATDLAQAASGVGKTSIEALAFDEAGDLIVFEGRSGAFYSWPASGTPSLVLAEAGSMMISPSRMGELLNTGPDNHPDAAPGFGYFGSDSDDLLVAGPESDLVLGGRGSDTILAGRGDDLIIGGEGQDVLYGMKGDDVFLFLGVRDYGDTIMDFESGRDEIFLFELSERDVRRVEQTGTGFIARGPDAAVRYDVAEGTLEITTGGGYMTVADFGAGTQLEYQDLRFAG